MWQWIPKTVKPSNYTNPRLWIGMKIDQWAMKKAFTWSLLGRFPGTKRWPSTFLPSARSWCGRRRCARRSEGWRPSSRRRPSTLPSWTSSQLRSGRTRRWFRWSLRGRSWPTGRTSLRRGRPASSSSRTRSRRWRTSGDRWECSSGGGSQPETNERSVGILRP